MNRVHISKVWPGLRLLGFISVGFGLGMLANIATHWNYWNGTIRAVQTVDFNILTHTLPYKLSTLLLADDRKNIQRTIDSNAGLFGIIVTDCKKNTVKCANQKILYTNSSSYINWRDIDPDYLQTQYFNDLRNPPPLFPEKEYEYSYSEEPVNTGLSNPGVIIGRVYYVRKDSPSFLSDYGDWLERYFFRFSVGRSQRYYMYFIVLIGILTAAILGWFTSERQLIYQKREAMRSRELLETQIKEAERAQQLLEAKNKLLRISTFNNVFTQLIDQEFTSVAGNVTQKLSHALYSVIMRLKNDARNIIHDINNAPLLSTSSFSLVEDLKKNLTATPLEEKSPLIEKIADLIFTTSDSVEALKIAIDDLRSITDLDGSLIDINTQLSMMKEQLHPSVKRWKIEFNLCSEPLIIKCNAWHLKSIIKNALYNSSSSLREKYFNCLENGENFQGEIKIITKKTDKKAIISIIDNGCGIPEKFLEDLYVTDKRLNVSAGETRGNGSIIVNAYLRLHEGDVHVVNNDISGATVQFEFILS